MLRPDQLARLSGLPAYWRFALTGGDGDAKRCFEPHWNAPGHSRTIEDILRICTAPQPGERWIAQKVLGVGVVTGEESNGLLVLDFDGRGSQSTKAFIRHFRHRPSDLPLTAANVSGKHGRAKLFFHVPPSWWPQFKGRSASWRSRNGTVVLEAIWQNGTGYGRHAVLTGDHPESSHQHPLYYRWAEENKRAADYSPSGIGVAEAPEWLLLGVLAQIEDAKGERTQQEKERSGEDDASPWERLSVREKIELVRLALAKCPNRLEKGSGTYEQVRRIMAGVLNEFGIEVATLILVGSDWDKANEWGRGSCAEQLESLYRSKTREDAKARINTLFYFARQNGWTTPNWAMPPIDQKELMMSYQKLLNEAIKEHSNRNAQAVLAGQAKREFGVDRDEFRRNCVDSYLSIQETFKSKTLEQVIQHSKASVKRPDVIDGYLARTVHVLAGASHSGKTTFASFLANRVLTGAPIDVGAVRHSVQEKGKVLFCTSDCSDMQLVQNLAIEGIDSHVAENRLRICSGIRFDDMLLICKTLVEFEPDLVIYDCLTSMACTGAKIGDAAYADPIRMLARHNGVAWPAAAHVILHHTRRDEPTSFSGTEQIKAAADELWMYYPPELLTWRKNQPRPQIGPTRHLSFEKSRTGYAGRLLMVSRDPFLATWTFATKVEGGSAVFQLTNAFRGVTHDEWRIASEWAAELDLAYHPRSLRRYLDQLVGQVLESERHRSRKTGRVDTHYRPLPLIRQAAKEMLKSRCDGVNLV